MSFPLTLGELRRSPLSEEKLRSRRVKDELRDNLIALQSWDRIIRFFLASSVTMTLSSRRS